MMAEKFGLPRSDDEVQKVEMAVAGSRRTSECLDERKPGPGSKYMWKVEAYMGSIVQQTASF